MFLPEKGSIATERDGVQKDLDNNTLADDFTSAERNVHKQIVLFLLNENIASQ